MSHIHKYSYTQAEHNVSVIASPILAKGMARPIAAAVVQTHTYKHIDIHIHIRAPVYTHTHTHTHTQAATSRPSKPLTKKAAIKAKAAKNKPKKSNLPVTQLNHFTSSLGNVNRLFHEIPVVTLL
jgi:hypothetical protein